MHRLLFFILLMPLLSAAQLRLECQSKKSARTDVFREGRRIMVETADQKRHFGNLRILDAQTILVRKDTVKLESVIGIQRRPSVIVVASTLVIIGSSMALAISPGLWFSALLRGSQAGIVGAGITFGAGAAGLPIGILLPSFGCHHPAGKWAYHIVQKTTN